MYFTTYTKLHSRMLKFKTHVCGYMMSSVYRPKVANLNLTIIAQTWLIQSCVNHNSIYISLKLLTCNTIDVFNIYYPLQVKYNFSCKCLRCGMLGNIAG